MDRKHPQRTDGSNAAGLGRATHKPETANSGPCRARRYTRRRNQDTPHFPGARHVCQLAASVANTLPLDARIFEASSLAGRDAAKRGLS